MAKTFKAAKLIASFCGGWWSAMSGATSVPLAFVALFSDGTHQKEFFAILAYVALWVLVFGIGLKNFRLQAQRDDTATRKKIKDSLAHCRIWIQDLHRRLDAISYFSYYDEKRQKFDHDYLEMENQAYRILKDKVGDSEAVSFADEERIPKVVVPHDAHFDMPAFKDRWIAYKFMFNRLEYKSGQLKIVEDKLDSKDFILAIDPKTTTPPVVQK